MRRVLALAVLLVTVAATSGESATATTTTSPTSQFSSLGAAWASNVDNFRSTANGYGTQLRKLAQRALEMTPEQWVESATEFPETARKWWIYNSTTYPDKTYTWVGALMFIVYVWFFTKTTNVIRATGMSMEQQQDLIEDWEPEPLVPRAPRGTVSARTTPIIIDAYSGKFVRVNGKKLDVLNCASCDFLGVASSRRTKETSKAALDKYTLGSCGPRGFYGTTDAHLSLESSLAEVMGAPQSITYSDHTSTIASAIPAFSKRSDILVVDDGVNHAIQTGCILSRSKTLSFRHNVTSDLEQVVASIGKTRKDVRKFIVVEGLYANSGDLCPLPEVMRIARRHHFRVILDDSLGFGVLGKRGRGTAEHFGMEPLDVDITLGSMATSLGSVGGFCVGNDEVVDHQRLSGAGYVFSASLPPFLCTTAESALHQIQKDPSGIAKLRHNASMLRAKLEESRKRFKIVGSFAECPVIHLRLSWHSDKPANDPSRVESARKQRSALIAATTSADSPGAATEARTQWPYAPRRPRPPQRRFQGVEDTDLDRVVEEALERGVLLARSRYLVTDKYAPASGLKLHVSSLLTEADMDKIVDVLEEAVEAAFESRSTIAVSPVKGRATGMRKRG